MSILETITANFYFSIRMRAIIYIFYRYRLRRKRTKGRVWQFSLSVQAPVPNHDIIGVAVGNGLAAKERWSDCKLVLGGRLGMAGDVGIWFGAEWVGDMAVVLEARSNVFLPAPHLQMLHFRNHHQPFSNTPNTLPRTEPPTSTLTQYTDWPLLFRRQAVAQPRHLLTCTKFDISSLSQKPIYTLRLKPPPL